MSLQDFMSDWHQWTEGLANPEKTALLSFVSLTRNLDDYPFHHRSSDTEKEAVRQWIVQEITRLPSFAKSKFHSASNLGDAGIRMLAERFISRYDIDAEDLSCGLLFSDDSSCTSTVNHENHLEIRSFSKGEEISEAWENTRDLANNLHKHLRFAFNEFWGYLFPTLKKCGNGLQLVTLLDMPADTLLGSRLEEESIEKQLLDLGEQFQLQNLTLGTAPRCQYSSAFPAGIELMAPKIEEASCQSLYPGSQEHTTGGPAPLGFLRILTTKNSTRKSEHYLVQGMGDALKLMVQRETKARELLFKERSEYLREYVRRCLALIEKSHYLGLKEGLVCFSVLRLAENGAFFTGYDAKATDTLLFAMQRAHLSNAQDVDKDDPFALAEARAELFRKIYGGVTLKK